MGKIKVLYISPDIVDKYDYDFSKLSIERFKELAVEYDLLAFEQAFNESMIEISDLGYIKFIEEPYDY